jgi:hypothetical protein
VTGASKLLKSLGSEMGLNYRLEISSLYTVKIIFGDELHKFGIQLSFFQNYVLMEDCSLSNSPGFTPLPLYDDVTIQSVNAHGILSYMQRICKTKIQYGERVIFPSSCSSEVSYFLQSYIEVVCCILKLHENVPSNAAFEIESLRIMIPSANTQFVFAGSLEKPIVAQKNKDKGFSSISGYILEKIHEFHPQQRNSIYWCRFLMHLSGLKESIVKDIVKLIETMGKDEKQISEPEWLLKVPKDLPSDLAEPGSNALYIADNHLYLLFRFRDEKDSVLLPLKRNLFDGGLDWWKCNPYGTGMQMLETAVFPKSKAEQFPGIASLITSLQRCSVSKIKS